MLSNGNRYVTNPSLYVLHETMKRLMHVKKGHQLLKRKSEALKCRLRLVAMDIVVTEENIVKHFKEAFIQMATAKFTNGEFGALVLENVSNAHSRVGSHPENIAGVNVNTLNCIQDGNDDFKLAGLGTGGHQISDVKKSFQQIIKQIVLFASLRSTCVLLDNAVKSTVRKVNGIDKVIIPRLENTAQYIVLELDEREREDFHRIKMMKAKKLKRQQEIWRRAHNIGSKGDSREALLSEKMYNKTEVVTKLVYPAVDLMHIGQTTYSTKAFLQNKNVCPTGNNEDLLF